MKSPEKKLLDIKFDCKLSIENNISSFCERASQKLHTLTRIFNYVNLSRRTALMKTFAMTQFDYCPLICMFHSRTLIIYMRESLELHIRIINPCFLNYSKKIIL